jgi:hypothetical protein
MTQSNTGKCFPTYFPLYYQTSENTFPEFTFPGIHFPKENYFLANKWGLSQLVILGSLYVPNDFLSSFSMVHSWITLEPSQYSYYNYQVRFCTDLCIHQTINYRCIGNVTHLLFFQCILWDLILVKFLSFHNGCY